MDTGRFRPDKGFEGAAEGGQAGGRVEFEKEGGEDPFGLDAFLSGPGK